MSKREGYGKHASILNGEFSVDTTKFVEAIFSLLQAALWPGLILIIFLFLRIPLRKLLQDPRISNISVKAGATGFEATIQKEQSITTAALLGASSAVAEDPTVRDLNDTQIKSLIYIVDETSTVNIAKQLEGASVRWIDEDPKRSSYLRRALEAVGIVVITTGVVQAEDGEYDAIIYVMHDERTDGDLQGMLYLLDRYSQYTERASIFIYDQSVPSNPSNSKISNPEQNDRERILKERGFSSATTPLELFYKVIRVIVRKKYVRAEESKGQISR